MTLSLSERHFVFSVENTFFSMLPTEHEVILIYIKAWTCFLRQAKKQPQFVLPILHLDHLVCYWLS